MPYRWTLTDLIAPYVAPVTLTTDPIGWDDGIYSIKRSDVYKGAFHEYTTSLKFYCNGGGKEFIDAVYAQDDIDGRIRVLVEYDCDGSGVYDELFNGIIDLSSYSTDGEYTTVKIEKSDLLTKLFSRDDISVDLGSTTSIGGSTITAVDTEQLYLSPMEVLYVGEWGVVDGYSIEDTETYTTVGGRLGAFQPQMTMVLSDLDVSNQIGGDYHFAENQGIGFPFFYPTGYEYTPFIVISEIGIVYPVTINWEIDFNGTITDTQVSGSRSIVSYKLLLTYGVLSQVSPPLTPIVLYDSGASSASPAVFNFSVQDSGSFSLNSGEGIVLEWLVEWTNNSNPSDVKVNFTYATSSFRINANTSFEGTGANSILVHEAFNQVVDAMADSDGNFYSEFYGRTDSQKTSYAEDGCGSKIAITNGLNIREFDKPIYASFNKLYNAMDCQHNIGMGLVNNIIRVEPIRYWFDGTTKLITLEKVNYYTIKNDNSRYVNKIEIGYQKWESEFRGGLQDPNSRREYSTSVNSAKGAYTKLSEYVASPYTIEFTRRKNITVNPNEDWRYDNDNFLIASKIYFRADFIDSGIGFDDVVLIYNVGILYTAGDSITITGSNSNDGTYTVTSSQLSGEDVAIFVSQQFTPETNQTIRVDGLIAAELYADGFTYGTGMDSISTAYNLRLTPARMIQSHLKTIAAGLQTIRGQIKFVKGDGNTSLQCSAVLPVYTLGCPEDYSGQQLFENQSFDWNDGNVLSISPIWGTEIYEFEYPLTYTEFKTIKANPYGYVEFYKFAGDVKNGFILSMEYKMKTGMTKFQLLKAII